jgi:hypothetical protein
VGLSLFWAVLLAWFLMLAVVGSEACRKSAAESQKAGFAFFLNAGQDFF